MAAVLICGLTGFAVMNVPTPLRWWLMVGMAVADGFIMLG